MTVKYFALLTNLGAAKLANAAALGTPLQITHMAVGDGGGALPIPNPAQTQLVGEKRRAALNSLSIDEANSSQIIAEQVIPETDGGWWIREIGLFDKDGVLIAIANCPETYKPQLQEGSGRTQTVRMVLIVSSTDAITLKIDPSVVLATRKYVDDQVIVVKAYTDDLMEKHLAATDPHSRYAPKASPALTGKPTAPTAAKTDNSTQLATTAHVKQSLAEYAPLASPALTGTPTTPTPAVGNNTQQVASAAFVQAAISALVASSPTTLDTLKKLADALGNDPDFTTTMTDALAAKMDKAKNGGDIPDVAKFLANLGLGDVAHLPQLTGIVGTSRNAKMSIPAASVAATFTADELIVQTGWGGRQYKLSGFSRSINLATTGSGGMDTGTAPATGYVALYAIYNPTSGATALLAVNATSAPAPEVYGGANMPAGYTASALVSVWGTSSGQFVVGHQMGRHIGIISNQLYSTAGSVLGYSGISLAAAVPPNGKKANMQIVASQTTPNSVIQLYLASTAEGVGAIYVNTSANSSSATTTSTNSGYAEMNIIGVQSLYFKMANTVVATYTFICGGYEI
ncbi:tail fiber protein [Yersinia enterocolitica]|uniref:phage tail protein n=1 Tax=Yersinia enterocolitica TaxID=630 RepID=UPI0005E811E9|nr:tail fiber protein [Yersinia enterocolitica]